MNATQLAAAAQAHLEAQGYLRQPQPLAGLDLMFSHGEERLALALLPSQPDAFAYLRAFEDGMQRMLAASQRQPDLRIGLALVLERTEASYRQALKKYSNSIVFEDVGIGLLLAGSGQPPLWLEPAEVNGFLRGLDPLAGR